MSMLERAAAAIKEITSGQNIVRMPRQNPLTWDTPMSEVGAEIEDVARAALLAALDAPDVLEALSDLEHARWSRWQAYLFSKCEENPDGSLTIPASYVDHWCAQIETPYAHLSETAKESDRKEARQSVAVIKAMAQGGS
jgi:hypothetical protein